ncbi:hypothetical protein K1W54_03320 [Micromonospora sp. CPCC 205371]|nr:hypothetical protein [Micromonospora sp. CPCC 205371]
MRVTVTNLWFGGQSVSGLTVTAEQTGGWFGGFVGDGDGFVGDGDGFVGDGEGVGVCVFVGEGEGEVPVWGVPVAAAAPNWVKAAATRAVPTMMRAGRRNRGWRDMSVLLN